MTAYDFQMARLIDAAGMDMVLVGDSLGMVFQGGTDTLSVTVDDMAYHGRCVAAGLETAHLTVDMPFMSYQISPAQALQTAGVLVQKGKAQSVKLEGGTRSAPAIAAIVEAGIPVVGHVADRHHRRDRGGLALDGHGQLEVEAHRVGDHGAEVLRQRPAGKRCDGVGDDPGRRGEVGLHDRAWRGCELPA